MPYVPPHLRTSQWFADPSLPKIATTPAEAQAMSKAVMGAPKNPLSSMLSQPAPKLAGQVSHKTPQQSGAKNKGTRVVSVTPNIASQQVVSSTPAPLANLQATKAAIQATAVKPVAAGSFGSMLPVPAPKPIKARAPKVKKVTQPVAPTHTAVQQATTVTTINSPEFDAAMDDILRTLFEDNMSTVKRIATANVGDFTRRANGSYKNERLESRYQGFKMQKLEEHAGKASDAFERVLRARFETAMQSVKRIASAHALDFATRVNGSYANERLESRFQGYLMASVNDFGLSVLRKIADNRVAALKTIS